MWDIRHDEKYLTNLEAPVGFEPTNKGFADLRLRPLGYSAVFLTLDL